MDNLRLIKEQVASFDAQVIEQLARVASDVEKGLLQDYPTMQPIYEKLMALAAPLLQSPTLTVLLSSLVTFLLVNSILTWSEPPPASQPYPLNRYDPLSARNYFDRRLPTVISRALFVTVQSLQFGLSLLKDKVQ
jgi:hypothetical protein